MYQKFQAVEPDKQERIINAAMKEFAEKGYAAASTNEIAKQAGISKGLLFHYFTSKKGLFLYIYDHAVAVLAEELYSRIDYHVTDLFDRLWHISKLKLAIAEKYPEMFRFVSMAYMENESEIKVDVDERNQEMLDRGYGRVLTNLDTSKFRDGVQFERVVQVIQWTLEGMGERERMRVKMMGGEMDVKSIMAEAEAYFAMFRRSFYREQFQ